ncbi:YcnI family protein [Isoptericola halotolerans]|uniref:YcnI family copper-binding membrane protein n=1 Tax=Isoptericola halotolerans TaxID=300560 RepID=UPI00388DC34A
MRKTLRAAGALTLTAGLVLAGAGSASAHVTVTPDTTSAGAYALLTFGVPHGCDTSPTTEVAIQIPEEIATVTPTVHAGWDVEKVMVELDEPEDDGHGGQRTERVAEVVYTTDTPLPADLRAAFELSVKLPDEPGTLVLPTVQTCPDGEAAWVQVAEDGQDPHGLDMPAPLIEVTAADGDGHGDDAADETTEDVADDAGSSEADTSGTGTASAADASAGTDGAGTSAVTWAALGLGAIGAVLGLVALLRTRSRQA